MLGPNGLPIVGAGAGFPPTARPLYVGSDAKRKVYEDVATLNLPPVVPGQPADARVYGDSGAIAVAAATLVMLDRVLQNQAELVRRLEAAGVLPPST